MADSKFSIERPGIKAEGELLQGFRREVADLLDRKQLGFPGAQPVSFSRRHIEELKAQDYYLCEKTDGMRYLMYCTQEVDGRELHYLIDRRNDFWHVPNLHFPLVGDKGAFHVSTLIDGELVVDKVPGQPDQPKFLVFDCLVLDGNSLMKRTLDKRLAYFQEKMFQPYSALYKEYPEELKFVPFIVEMKKMEFAYAMDMMFLSILPQLPHGNDGLIFTCRNTDYKHGTDQHILKWKPKSDNSVDFRLDLDFPVVQPDAEDRKNGVTQPWVDYDAMPTCNLCANRTGYEDEWYATMHITPKEWDDLKALNEPIDDRIVECYMDDEKRWRMMRWRDDKDKPNHISTVESVIESIMDGVSQEELIAAKSAIRDQWKKRGAEEEARRRAGMKREASQVHNGAGKRKAEEQAIGRPSPGPPGQKREEQ